MTGIRTRWGGAILVAAALFSGMAVADEIPMPGEQALANRLTQLARSTMRVEEVQPGHWQQAAALLEAALRLDPTEPRYHRLLIQLRMEQQEVELALEALRNYRRIRPQDQVAQVQLIDLHLSRMETADAKLEYLEQLVGAGSVAPEVRSHAALERSRLLFERGQREQAIRMLSQALRLNPQNVAALRLRYE